MIKPCKLNESVVAITNTSRVYLLTYVWVFCFLKVQRFTLSLTLDLNYTKATRRWVRLVNCHFLILILRMACSLHVVETYIKGTSWKRCYLVTSSRLINVYFTNQVSILLISAEIKKWKSHFFFQVNLLLKQPFADVYQRRCSKELCNIHRKTPVLESLFNKVPVIQTCYFKSNSNEGVLLQLLQNF